jgi:hypothetical protein
VRLEGLGSTTYALPGGRKSGPDCLFRTLRAMATDWIDIVRTVYTIHNEVNEKDDLLA